MNVFHQYELQFDNQKRKELFAEALTELRKQKGLTAKETAKQLGINYRTYMDYEKAISEPKMETLVRMSFFFECPIDIMVQKFNTTGNKEEVLKTLKSLKDEIGDIKADALANGNSGPMYLAEVINKFLSFFSTVIEHK